MDWITPGFETLELSTQVLVREALRRGHRVEVLDPSASFIRLHGGGKTEYVLQATRTSADSYVSPLVMENKLVTKQVLDEAGIRTPRGRSYTDPEAACRDELRRSAAGAVVKPNSTNFGIGVSVLPAPISEGDFAAAVAAAFSADQRILVEELVPGPEYRFLVVADAVRAVLRRVPANVQGDGTSTIAALVSGKNADPRRGKGYRSPLEKIALGREEAEYLASQGLTFESVPRRGQTVFLRRNSNISTGGDSIDVTDDVHPGYHDLAVASAAAVGARICGVDMIVGNASVPPTDAGYAVIELNFNPALHIHDYPAQGRNRHVERFVLDLLEL